MTNEGFDEFAGDNAFKRRRRRGKYDCQVLYKQSIKSKLNQDNNNQQKGQVSSQNEMGYENVTSTSPINPLKRPANSAQDALSGILSPLMKMPALGTGGSPNVPVSSGNDNNAQFLANLTLSNLLGKFRERDYFFMIYYSGYCFKIVVSGLVCTLFFIFV